MLVELGRIDGIYQTIRDRCESRVLLFVSSLEFDSICAGKMLMDLLTMDFVEYIVIPLNNHDDLARSWSKYAGSRPVNIHHVFMVGFGGNMDLEEFLDLGDSVTLYLLDSHRPIHLSNVFSETRIVVVDSGEIVQAIQDLENYHNKTWSRTSMSSHIYSLCLMLNRGSNNMLWNCIVGMTSTVWFMSVRDKRFGTTYELLENEVFRNNHQENTGKIEKSIHGQISIEQEYDLVLLRHWNLYDSMANTPFVHGQLDLRRSIIPPNLDRFLATVGIPLAEAKQLFVYMDTRIKDLLDTGLKQSRFENADFLCVSFPYFFRNLGFQHKLSAYDFIHILNGLAADPLASTEEIFFSIVRVLDMPSSGMCLDTLTHGLDLAKSVYRDMSRLTESIVYHRWIKMFRKSFHLVILSPQTIRSTHQSSRNSADTTCMWNRVPCLKLLGYFLSKSVVSHPFLILATNMSRTSLVLGHSNDGFDFGPVFNLACKQLDIDLAGSRNDVVSIDSAHLSRFLRVLPSLL